jgi:hypothetical protein
MDYLSSWLVEPDESSNCVTVTTLELNFSHQQFFEGVLKRVRPLKTLIIRESMRDQRFDMMKFKKILAEKSDLFETLELNLQTLSVEDFKIFRDLPVQNKYLFSPYLDPSFSASDLKAIEPYFKGDKNSYL